MTKINFNTSGGATDFSAAVSQPNTKIVKYTGSSTLQNGMVVCYNFDATSDADKIQTVEDPVTANLLHVAGVVIDATYGDDGLIEIATVEGDTPGVYVWCDEDVTVGDTLVVENAKLAAQIDTAGVIIARALESVDRSGTAGVVLARLGTGIPTTTS